MAPVPPPSWRDLPIAVGVGLVFYFISTPKTLDFLQWGVWIPLLIRLGRGAARRDFLLGWLAGCGLNLAGFYWIVETIVVFSNLPLPVAIGVLALFAAYGGIPYGLLALVYPRLAGRAGRGIVLLVPATWVALETTFPTLFPYHQGDLQFRVLPLFQLASVLGVTGVSFLVMIPNVLGTLWIQALRSENLPGSSDGAGSPRLALLRPLIPVTAATALAFLLLFAWGTRRVERIDAAASSGARLNVGLIQGNYGVQELRRTPRAAVFERYRLMTEEAAERGAELVIWGEGASPYAPNRKWEEVEALVSRLDIDLLAGGTGKSRIDGQIQLFNSAFALPRSGGSPQRYDKNILLAFGEYMPGSRLFPSLKGKIRGIGDLTPGDGLELLSFSPSGKEVRILPLICYEAILDGFVRAHARKEPNLVVNLTHDAWFGDTACPHQFLMLVAGRAVEHGVSIARVANTGISAVIDPTGRIRGQTPLFKPSVTVETVSLETFPTAYSWGGMGFQLLCCLVAGGAWIWYRRNQRTQSAERA